MFLQLKRSPEQDAAAAQFVESLTARNSPNFHKWISAAEYGRRFGADPSDIAAISQWLASHGFTVNAVPSHNMVIDFSGTAAQVREAFHTELHALDLKGKHHFANATDPQIPAALAPAVTGVVSLSDIMPRPMLEPKAQYTVSPTTQPIAPGDLQTIYNLNPAFAAGYTGLGQSIVVVEDTDLYSGTADWNTFRNTFGLNQFTAGSLTQVHPSGGKGGSCVDPGVNEDDTEAAIDVEWASAAAPNAAILMAACSNTTNFGGFIALQNMLTNGGALPGVVSVSYGESETQGGAALNAYINTLYQTAAAAGVSVFVSSGDSAAAGADRDGFAAVYGITVSGFASTVYNVAVGGTDFGDYVEGSTNRFWTTLNTTTYNSAKSYIPEIPWNDSCASSSLANFLGYNTAFGIAGFCNAEPGYASTIGGSGGPSGCATGSRTQDYAVSGTCAGYPKPSWQSIPGNPNDGVRDLPDVALFASNGFWGHYYVVCFSAEASCSGAPSTWAGFGGTSVSSPIMAAIQALANQALGEPNVGNPNPVYYQIGQTEYGTAANLAACNSSTGPYANCTFNDITQGDMVVPCAGSFNCYLAGEAIGSLSTSGSSYQPAYSTTPGWDFATGIGSVNAFNLINSFVAAVAPTVAPTAAPAAPALLSPANTAANVVPEAPLTWNASPGATSYDVYFGTSAPPPLVANTPALTYTPAVLSPATTYYWAIGARNSAGANASMPFSFTTGCVAALSPLSAVSPAAGTSGTIPITAASSCAWTAASTVSWITISSGASGTGNGSVAYKVAADTGAARIGTINVSGQLFTITQAVSPLISTLAGGSVPPTGSTGTSVSIPVGYGVASDSSGNTYFASPTLSSVFKVDPSGNVTRIAGTGVYGYSGDGGPALSAQLNGPQGVAVDSSGNVYISDTGNRRVRVISSSTGTISTLAGTGSCCYGGDGGPATSALMSTPLGLAVDGTGNLYIADSNNERVWQVTPTGTIATYAGNGLYGFSGDGGPAISATLYGPSGLAVDSSGNLYIADRFNERIRMVSPSGTISTVAGSTLAGFSGDGAAATSARLNTPSGIAVDSSANLYIADYGNERIRKVTSSGTISTFAGNGTAAYSGDSGPATSASLNLPEAVSIDPSGNLHIADSANTRLRQVTPAGMISTAVGGALGDGASALLGYFSQPAGVVRDGAGNTYVSDTANHRVRLVAASGAISTVAGTGTPGFSGDGALAVNAQLHSPQGLALDSAGNLYIADSLNFRIRKVDPSGNITTFAGNGILGYTGDNNLASSAAIGTPYGLAADSSGNLYTTDPSFSVVRKIAAAGTISTVAGTGFAGFSGDGGPATSATLRGPYAVAVDSTGDLFIADRSNYRVREVTASGTISTVAGSGFCCFAGDGAAATSAYLYLPSGVAVDSSGTLYIADSDNNRIRQVNARGIISTVAGNGTATLSGDGAAAANATLQIPLGLAIDPSGTLAIADSANNAVRLLTPAGTQAVLTVQSAHTGSFTQGQSTASYTITVTNSAGAGPTAGTVTLTEIPQPGLAVTALSGSGWTCTALSCTRPDALPGGASYPPISVTVTVSSTAPAQLSNQVIVSGGGSLAGARFTDVTAILQSN
jgi:sugar lactone lactonase YvrE